MAAYIPDADNDLVEYLTRALTPVSPLPLPPFIGPLTEAAARAWLPLPDPANDLPPFIGGQDGNGVIYEGLY
jgi:hypothetical protein